MKPGFEGLRVAQGHHLGSVLALVGRPFSDGKETNIPDASSSAGAFQTRPGAAIDTLSRSDCSILSRAPRATFGLCSACLRGDHRWRFC